MKNPPSPKEKQERGKKHPKTDKLYKYISNGNNWRFIPPLFKDMVKEAGLSDNSSLLRSLKILIKEGKINNHYRPTDWDKPLLIDVSGTHNL